MIYLASPYSNSDPTIVNQRIEDFLSIDAYLIAQGYHTVSPLYKHFTLDKNPNIGTDWKYWEDYARELMSACTELKIIKSDGWQTSEGVMAEMELAEELGLTLTCINPRKI